MRRSVAMEAIAEALLIAVSRSATAAVLARDRTKADAAGSMLAEFHQVTRVLACFGLGSHRTRDKCSHAFL
jgi:hypothetical protein